jgi:hypothetical protein
MTGSFSEKVKEELCHVNTRGTAQAVSELAGIVHTSGSIFLGSNGAGLQMSTGNKNVVNRVFSLVEKVYSLECELSQSSSQIMDILYTVRIRPDSLVSMLKDMAVPFGLSFSVDTDDPAFRKLIQTRSQKQSYIRGCLLGGGVISDPESEYSLEILSSSEESANAIRQVLSELDIQARISKRGDQFRTYVKDVSSVSEVLTLTGAHGAVLQLEDIRLVREIRNNVNRQINFENANIDKAIDSAQRQLLNIRYIMDTKGLDFLSPALREAAQLRLENPEATLQELSQFSDGISKSGINNRLRKINLIADELRDENI